MIDVPFATETTAKAPRLQRHSCVPLLGCLHLQEKLAVLKSSASMSPKQSNACVRPFLTIGLSMSLSARPAREKQRALRFDLGGGYCLLLKIGATGPEPFSRHLDRLWNLAPLEEEVSSGLVA